MAIRIYFKDGDVKVFDEATHYGANEDWEAIDIYEIDDLVATVSADDVKLIERDNFKGEEV